MTTQMTDLVYQCDICLMHHDVQVQEPLLQHDLLSSPWPEVAADLCSHSDSVLLVVLDCFTNFIEVDSHSS